MEYDRVLSFWFKELSQKQWFEKDEDLDIKIKTDFHKEHSAARKGELFSWRATPRGRLAEVIVLDQFSRNMFRNQSEAFSYDGMALILAQEAIACNSDKELNLEERSFLYMPFMHSESRIIHEKAASLFLSLGLKKVYEYEILHKKIIDRFNRYPHRNKILNRPSTPDEIEFLKEENSSF